MPAPDSAHPRSMPACASSRRVDPPRRRLLALAAAPVLAPLAACRSTAPDASAEALARALASRPVALLGEVHDNRAQHALRAAALAQHLHAGARPALAFEQFDREQQPLLDALGAETGDAEARADRVIARAGAKGWDWPLYRPYLVLAFRYRLPVVAANLSRADAARVSRAPDFGALFDAATQRRLRLDALPEAFLAGHRQAVDDGHCNALPPAALPAMARAQIARDAVLLESIRPYLAGPVVLLTGNGHARNDLGLPFFMNAAERARTVTIGLLERGDGAAALAARYDVALFTATQPRPDPCAAFRAGRAG